MRKLRIYHFGCDLGNGASNRLSVPSVVRHFKLDRIANFQVLYIAVKLTKMKKESRLTFTALDETVGMLKIKKKEKEILSY